MENFNYYITFNPKEFEYGNSELILKKRVPLNLYLENYEVCMTEFCSTSIKHPMQYIEIENILKPELTNLINFFTAVTIPLDTENNNDTLNEKISRELMTYYYFFINQLFYKSPSIVNIAENQVVIIYQFDLNRALVIINKKLLANNYILFANFLNNILITSIEISQNLENGIVRHNSANSENKINLSTFYTYKTSNDTLYEKKYNELTPDEKTSIHNDYIKNKGKNIQYIDSDGVKIKFTENSIKLVQNSNNFTVNYLKRNAKSIELVLNESLTICSDAKIDKLIIECDLIPFQLFNNFSKRIIKTINIGTMLQNSEPLKNSYFKVIKERINSINITISFIKNITYIYDFKQDDINITLHFRKIK